MGKGGYRAMAINGSKSGGVTNSKERGEKAKRGRFYQMI
jgi:hypothetical protein